MDWEIHDGKQQYGPRSEAWIVEAIGRGMNSAVVIRRVGSDEWKGLRSHPTFALALDRTVNAPAPGLPSEPAARATRSASPKGRASMSVVGPIGGGLIAVALIAWAMIVRSSSGSSTPSPVAAPEPRPEAPPPPEPVQILATKKTLEDALAVTTPLMRDDYATVSDGAKLLAAWSLTNLTWRMAEPPSDETTVGLVQKDPDSQRGKRLCAPGTIVQIAETKTPQGPFSEGIFMTESLNFISYVAVRSSGDLVANSVARFCGIVTGKYDYPNSAGGTGHAIQLVGMFDLPANRGAR